MKFGWRFSTSSIHRPYVQRWTEDDGAWGFSLSWGSKWTDPVWSIDVEHVRVPRWLDRWLLDHTPE